MKTDIEIAQSIELQPIVDVVKKIGLVDDESWIVWKIQGEIELW